MFTSNIGRLVSSYTRFKKRAARDYQIHLVTSIGYTYQDEANDALWI